ncbi:SLOG family protein [Methylorubrum sp. SL192]|uniref:SLOG family protein n=1 Tax=Methylorubrum sp. SL192 TaxID=2995167 RepID=UPI003FA37665
MFGRVAHDVPDDRIQAERERAARERQRFHAEMDRRRAEKGINKVIQGGATGADALARGWARDRGIIFDSYIADWGWSRRAGPIRNARMLADGKPHLVIAFPGGRGTADMIRQAEAAGVPVVRVQPVPSPDPKVVPS